MNLAYALAELRRRPGRTVAGVASVAVGVALLLSLQAYAAGYPQAARAPLTEIGSDVVAQRQGLVPKAFSGVLFPHSTSPLHREEIEAIRRLPGVEAVGEAVFFWDFELDGFLSGLGLDPAQGVGPGRLAAGVRSGRFLHPGDRGVVVLDESYARQFHLVPGDTVAIAGRSFQVVGLVDTSRAGQVANANAYIPLADAQALSRAAPNVQAVFDFRPDDANMLFIRANPAQGPAVAEAVRRLLGKEAIVTTPRSFDQVLGTTFALVDRFGLLVGLAGLLVATAGLLRTAAAGLLERRRDVGLMRAVGWRRRDVTRQLVIEATLTAGLGALVGILLALGVAWGLSLSRVTVPVPWELSPTPHFLPGGARQLAVMVPLAAKVGWLSALGAMALALLGGWLVSLWLARKAARINPVEVWRVA